MAIHYSVSMTGIIKETWDGVITSINIERQPYEAEITARGSCFHIILESISMAIIYAYQTGMQEQR